VIRTRVGGWGVLAAGIGLGLAPLGAAGQDASLIGAWAPETYVLESGTRHDVAGRIFFTDTDWTVLFFVTENGEARRGSAEGGTYTTTDDRLVLTHLYNLSVGEAMEGIAESPLQMTLRSAEDGTTEATTYAVDGDRLTLYFPSGNRMEFIRASSF